MAYSIPVARYLGRGTHSTATPKEELEAESEGARIPSVVRWLGKATDVKAPDIKARYNEGTIRASSVDLIWPFWGRRNFNRLRKSGLRHLGRRYDIEVYEEPRPGAFCGHYSG